MARALWTGSLSFGLVTIPVEIHTAVKDKGPRFRRYGKKTTLRSTSSVWERDGAVGRTITDRLNDATFVGCAHCEPWVGGWEPR